MWKTTFRYGRGVTLFTFEDRATVQVRKKTRNSRSYIDYPTIYRYEPATRLITVDYISSMRGGAPILHNFRAEAVDSNTVWLYVLGNEWDAHEKHWIRIKLVRDKTYL